MCCHYQCVTDTTTAVVVCCLAVLQPALWLPTAAVYGGLIGILSLLSIISKILLHRHGYIGTRIVGW